jgi:hypothetical protein
LGNIIFFAAKKVKAGQAVEGMRDYGVVAKMVFTVPS